MTPRERGGDDLLTRDRSYVDPAELADLGYAGRGANSACALPSYVFYVCYV